MGYRVPLWPFLVCNHANHRNIWADTRAKLFEVRYTQPTETATGKALDAIVSLTSGLLGQIPVPFRAEANQESLPTTEPAADTPQPEQARQ